MYGGYYQPYWDQPDTMDELEHYGVLGMKWGIRRYQNKDGTLTAAGKKRYAGDTPEQIATSERRKSMVKKAAVVAAIGIASGAGLYMNSKLAASATKATIAVGVKAVNKLAKAGTMKQLFDTGTDNLAPLTMTKDAVKRMINSGSTSGYDIIWQIKRNNIPKDIGYEAMWESFHRNSTSAKTKEDYFKILDGILDSYRLANDTYDPLKGITTLSKKHR